jgi:hypothetical protein
VNRLDPSKTEKKAFIIDAAGLELANKLQQKRVARECADWIERKVDIKTIKQSNLLHGKMYHVATAGVEDAILGSSNFTVRGLGLGNAGNNIELNLIVDGNRDRQELKQWFDELWGNEALVKDVKQDVLNYLKQLYENNTPEFIYYKTLFHIFEKFLGDAGKTDADLGKTSLFETGIWKALFEFQKDGAKGAINKILKHNGCIIADSVGLGKTYEALAVMKYFELKNERVLVLCPKKLRDNWTVYKANSLLNPFVSDRFRYDVVSHTDLSRETGYSGDINLATLNWGNYDLIVIDESHNFRNNTPARRTRKGTSSARAAISASWMTSSNPASAPRFSCSPPPRSTTTSKTSATSSTSSPRTATTLSRNPSASAASRRPSPPHKRFSPSGPKNKPTNARPENSLRSWGLPSSSSSTS